MQLSFIGETALSEAALSESALSESTQRAIAAAGKGDLDAVGRALADREAAMAAASPLERARALQDGETLGRVLAEIKRNIVAETSRLEQLRSTFANSARNRGATSINLQA